jgi:hypothetical protein
LPFVAAQIIGAIAGIGLTKFLTSTNQGKD